MSGLGTGQPGQCNTIRGMNPSYSWEQPGSGLLGMEGRCGQTCVANLLKNTRPSVHVSPESLVSNGAWDPTPGSLPSTLLRMLNHRTRGRRYAIHTERRAIFRAHLHNPIGCLLQWEANVLHWVTVVAMHGDVVYFNHWGRQDCLVRSEFDRRWGFQGQGAVDWVVSRAGQLSGFTSIG